MFDCQKAPPMNVRRLSFRTKRYLFNMRMLESRTRQDNVDAAQRPRCKSEAQVRKNSSNLLHDFANDLEVALDKIEQMPEIITFSSLNVTVSYSEE